MKRTHVKTSFRLVAATVLALSAAATAWADYSNTVMSFNPVAYYRLSETAAVPAASIYANSGTLGAAANGYGVLDATNGEPGIRGTSVRFTNPRQNIGTARSKV